MSNRSILQPLLLFKLHIAKVPILLILFLKILALLCGFSTTSQASCGDRPSPGVDWSGCVKINRIMTGYDFRNAKLNRVNFADSDLAGADMSGADLTNAVLIRVRLRGADLSKAILTKVTLDRADLSEADLSSAQLMKASLTRANLSNSRLSGSNLEKADLERAILTNADLTGTILRGASLARADLRDARFISTDLENTRFYLADLRGADLSRSIGLVQAQLIDTCGDDTTKLPSGLTPPPSWKCVRIQNVD